MRHTLSSGWFGPVRWLPLYAALSCLVVGCNPGQCLRQSDCPLGSECKKGMCKVPKPAPAAQRDAGEDATTSEANVVTSSQQASSSSESSPSDASGSSSGSTASDATVSEQSSNLDSTSDTSATVSQ